jgi:hypothetical protein
MIIQSKIQSPGLQNRRSLRAVGVWSLAILCGSIVAACSGTIETPTEEFPPRQGGSSQAQTSDDDDTPPRAPASASNDDDDGPPVVSNDDEDDTPAASAADDEETPPADDTEDPPAGDPPAAELSFEADIFPILSDTCGPCHAGAGAGGNDIADPDVATAFEEATRVEDRVLDRIESGTMPPGCSGPPGSDGCMSEEDFADLEAWYEAGAPE